MIGSSGSNSADHSGLGQVTHLVVIASSSRAGSTLLSEIFRSSRSVLGVQGELTPYFNLAGLCHPTTESDSDGLSAQDARLPHTWAFGRLLRSDIGRPAARLDEPTVARFREELAWRLGVQWPDVTVPTRHVEQAMESAKHHLANPSGMALELFHCDYLANLSRRHPINPWYYDLPKALLRARFSSVESTSPPGSDVVEMPPFILARPWRRADDAELAGMPLVLKTPSNSYRLGFLRALLPQARIQVVHLVRNPGAVVNGLMDGWRDRGFYNRKASTPLRISGYYDGDRAWTGNWWKFDQPPGWQQFAGSPLPEVCGFQWRAANEFILRDAAQLGLEYVRISFDDMIRNREGLFTTLRALEEFIGIRTGSLSTDLPNTLPVVMSTGVSGSDRWLGRFDVIRDTLLAESSAVVAERLGYNRFLQRLAIA
jgi:hypothetical protein